MVTKQEHQHVDLTRQVGALETLALNPDNEAAWIDVIHKMDAVYVELVHYQVELEQKNTALEEAQQFIRSVLASMTDVLVVCDVQGRIQQVNRALEVLTGRSQAQLLQQPVATLFAPSSLPHVEQFSEGPRADTIVDCEVSLMGANGEPAPLAMNCSTRYDSDGRQLGMVLIGRPVGELRRTYEELSKAHHALKETQRQLVHSEKMASLGRLVAGVAHELNNPISFVFGNTHALKRYVQRITEYLNALESRLDAASYRELRRNLKINHVLDDLDSLLDGTLEGAERVSDIVQDLRRFSSGQKEDISCFELPEVVRTATHWVLKAVRVKPKLSYALPERLRVCAQKGHVHQILVNLVQNAVDAMAGQPEQGLHIACGRSGMGVWIKVRDQGPGIEDAVLNRVFDPFYTTKPAGQGTGLGLSVSYNLAVEQGGTLQVENHPRGGAEFTLSFPDREADHA